MACRHFSSHFFHFRPLRVCMVYKESVARVEIGPCTFLCDYVFENMALYPNFVHFLFCYSAGLLEFKYALDLTRYLENETNYIPWDAGYSSLSSLTGILPKSEKIYTGLRVSFCILYFVI
jgi:hypothetical protein